MNRACPGEPSSAGGVEVRSPFTGALSWGGTAGPSSPVLTRRGCRHPGKGLGPEGRDFPSGGRPGGGEGGGLALPPHAGNGPLPPEGCLGAKSWRPRRRPGCYSERHRETLVGLRRLT